MIRLRINSKFSFSILEPRFELETGFPTLMFIGKEGNTSQIYHGPRDKPGLLSFINEQLGWVPDVIKVR